MKVKPYMLVQVNIDAPQRGRYHYIGQAMSFETPEHTVMVRRVPLNPGTLEELPVAQLSAVTGKFRAVHYAKVRGAGAFPVDMLRYDVCVPLNFRLIPDRWGNFVKPEQDSAFGMDELIVAKVSRSMRDHNWTPERWSSFLWTITPIKSEALTEDV